MPNKSGRAWKMTRATVHKAERERPRSNKYSKSDSDHDRRPGAGARDRVWVAGYTRSDGTRVEGHYRTINAAA